MAGLSGKTGTVDGACNDITSWEVNISTDMLESTSFCSAGFREYVAGLKGATGSVNSVVRYVGESSISLSNSEGGVTVSGNVLWNEEGITNDVSELQEYSQGFTFTGAIVIT